MKQMILTAVFCIFCTTIAFAGPIVKNVGLVNNFTTTSAFLLTNGYTYSAYMTAVSNAGVESAPSNTVSWVQGVAQGILSWINPTVNTDGTPLTLGNINLYFFPPSTPNTPTLLNVK